MLRYEGDIDNEPVCWVLFRADPMSVLRVGATPSRDVTEPLRARRTPCMDSLASWSCPARWILAGLLLWGTFQAGDAARAQTLASGGGGLPAPGQGPTRDVGAAAQAGSTSPVPAAPRAQQPRPEPSAAYRESLRKTLEKRRQRRARSAQQGLDEGPRSLGAIVPWPMPPALIIRHTRGVHGEVDSLLGRLRR
jgi:hypothetical protein